MMAESIETIKIGEKVIPLTDDYEKRPVIRSFFDVARCDENVLDIFEITKEE